MYSRDEMEDYANGGVLLGDDPIAAAMIRQVLAENASLQQKLDLMADDPGAQYFMGIAEGQRIYEKLKGAPFQVIDSPELAMLRDQVARLQARLDAGPSVEQLRDWANEANNGFLHAEIRKTANRMERAADGK